MSTFECPHDFVLAVRVINGNDNFGNQCRKCGKWAPVKKSTLMFTAQRAAMKYDNSLAAEWSKKRSDYYTQESKKREYAYQAERDLKNTEWWDTYNSYQRSEAWKKKRQLALSRDQHYCRGCMNAPATQVHHLTYPPKEMLGSEPLYWLVSLCDSCHDMVHVIKDSTATAKAWF